MKTSDLIIGGSVVTLAGLLLFAGYEASGSSGVQPTFASSLGSSIGWGLTALVGLSVAGLVALHYA